MITLGIDPGLQRTGYAILLRTANSQRRTHLVEAGVITSDVSQPLPARLLEIGQGLVEVLQQFEPECLAIEEVYSARNHPQAGMLLSHVRGLILYLAAFNALPVHQFSARSIKQRLTGSGRAPKEQMQRAIQRELGLAALPEPHDAADACAVALCALG